VAESSPSQVIAAALRRAEGATLVLTGAGVSAASGIPTFRGEDEHAVWKHDVLERATRRYFVKDPVGSWRWYRGRFSRLALAQPNAAHSALVDIERWHTATGLQHFLLVTQNIDPLHERAGSGRLVKIHGSSDLVRCSAARCRGSAEPTPIASVDFAPFDERPLLSTLPRCPLCRALMRPHILWFDETYDSHPGYQWSRVAEASRTMRLVLAIGTSFSVNITAYVGNAAGARGIPLIVVDPGDVDIAEFETPTLHVRERAEVILPVVAALLTSGCGLGRSAS
jgi:NAD-dependent deacetylase